MRTSSLLRPYLVAVIVIAVVILAASLAVQAGTPVCAKCGRYIDDGQYIQAGDQYYHPDHFVCARCGKPIGANKYFQRDGKIYDRACYEELFAMRCAWCGKLIEGEYVTHGGNNYHQACYSANLSPKCAWCSEPILDSFITYEGKAYHNKCYTEHVALRCGLCGGIVDGQYTTTFRGGAWHPWHKGKAPECDFCGAFIDTSRSESFVRYPDNRYLCNLCAETAVTNIGSLKSLADSLASILSSMSMLISTADLEFQLLDKNEMASQGDPGRKDRRGLTDFREYSQFFGLVRNRRLTVFILNGLPRIECVEVLSHELMHVWLINQGRTKTAPQLCEGSCDYASLLVLKQFPCAETDYLKKRMLGDPDSVYGDGLRHVKDFVESKGTAAWLDYITKNDKNPW